MHESILPPEIWCKIFELSCTDGGYTGHSLSLVSKYFNAISGPYRFQSISLINIKYVLRFLKVLRNSPPNLRRLRYLEITYTGDLMRATYSIHSNWDSSSEYEEEYVYSRSERSDSDDDDGDNDSIDTDEDETYPEDSANTDSDLEDEDLTKEEVDDFREDIEFLQSPEANDSLPLDYPIENPNLELHGDKLFMSALSEILEMCSETLIIVSISVIVFSTKFRYHFPVLPAVYMPALQELTWCGPLTHEGPPQGEGPHNRYDHEVCFPSLERLFLGVTVSFDVDTSRLIARQCPKLLYLRSNLPSLYRNTLRAALPLGPGVGTTTSQPEHPAQLPFATPPSVIQHLIQFPDQWINFTSNILEERGLKANDLKKYVDHRVKLVYRTTHHQRLQNDWKDRVAGGPGSWAFRECNFDDRATEAASDGLDDE
ncbi:hypothetical protein BDN72DRAFT_840687 [Pluteus cervinus]|uniref:Uncharacterized protein n=1 Tax=Pluteus cervinus TaxID=181527 RepID=A0ACD3AUT3_9AGAR|nr:hypothetical protein BDN72DRAFT_840687 [Pluteus cervinus]